MLLKCCSQYVRKFGKLSSGHRIGKCQLSFQSQRRAMPKYVQITIQLHSFHMLAMWCSNSFKLVALVVKKPSANPRLARDASLIPRWGKIPWRRKWQPTPVFLPGKSHGQRSSMGLSSWGSQRFGDHWSDLAQHTGFSSMWTDNFQKYKPSFQEAEELEIKLPTFVGSQRKQGSSRKICFIDYAKAFDCVDHNKLWKILKEMGVPGYPTCLLRNL